MVVKDPANDERCEVVSCYKICKALFILKYWGEKNRKKAHLKITVERALDEDLGNGKQNRTRRTSV